MKYILGIDQGGTKTAAAIMNETGEIIGQGISSGAYYPVEGPDSAFEKVEEAVAQAEGQAGISREEITVAIAGITGADWEGDTLYVSEKLKKILEISDLHAYNDAVIALYCGSVEACDMVLCAGTGMNAAVRTGEDTYFVFGDYIEESMQGGSALARRAIRKVFDAQIGLGKETGLTEVFLKFAGETSVDRLLHRYMMEDGFSSEIRYLVPEILETAARGDFVAGRLTEEYGRRMAEYISVGLARVSVLDRERKVILAGSVWKGKNNLLTRQVMQCVKEQENNVKIILADQDPVVGACRMGRMRTENGKKADDK